MERKRSHCALPIPLVVKGFAAADVAVVTDVAVLADEVVASDSTRRRFDYQSYD